MANEGSLVCTGWVSSAGSCQTFHAVGQTFTLYVPPAFDRAGTGVRASPQQALPSGLATIRMVGVALMETILHQLSNEMDPLPNDTRIVAWMERQPPLAVLSPFGIGRTHTIPVLCLHRHGVWPGRSCRHCVWLVSKRVTRGLTQSTTARVRRTGKGKGVRRTGKSKGVGDVGSRKSEA